MAEPWRCCFAESPLGPLLLAGPVGALAFLGFPAGCRSRPPAPEWLEDPSPFAEARRQLEAYFAGRRRNFELPLAPGGTPFQAAAWRALQAIPYGETRTYARMAAEIGRPRAVRALGAANGANPLPILIPCHRLVGSDGSLTGFGGGLAAKAHLLRLEGLAVEERRGRYSLA